MTAPSSRTTLASALVVAGLALGAAARGDDQPQWGQRFSRNMVSPERGLPATFDPKSGRNVRWSVPLGTQCYSTPIAAGGRVFIGTNNEHPRDPAHEGDRGVLMCFDAADGQLKWQLVVPKLDSDIFLDWPKAGICSPATVEGDRVYTVTNRDEVVCLDLQGMSNGNDGPYHDEGPHMTPHDQPRQTPGPLDADILWLLDLRAAAGVRPHDSAQSSILIDGPILYLNTSNGLNSTHTAIEKPEAPSLVAVEKATGRLLAREREGISARVFHNSWGSPALAELNSRRQVIFGAGDGVCYGFEALRPEASARSSNAAVDSLRLVWRFDGDPTAPKENIHSYIRNRNESPSDIKSMPVVHAGRVYITLGGDIWWGKRQCWLKCFEPVGTGDITSSALRWSCPLEKHCCSTPAVHAGLVYAADCAGKVYCVDAQSGQPHWVHDAGGEIWASPLVADGKVYIGTRKGDFWTLAAGKEKRVLGAVRLESGIPGSAVAANGTLYVACMSRLYAFREGDKGAAEQSSRAEAEQPQKVRRE